MSKVVNVYEAKTKLSELLNAVENGEDVVVARAGRPCGLGQILTILFPKLRPLLQEMILMHRFSLDTHTLVSWVQGDPLATPALAILENFSNHIFVSTASGWEIAMKEFLGILQAPTNVKEAMDQGGLKELAITWDHANAVKNLRHHHGDSLDGMIIARAQSENCSLITRDSKMS